MDFGECKSFKSNRKNMFDHSIWVILSVDTTYLWEISRLYVWRRMGQHEWKTTDGSQVTINRIHVKT